MNFKDGGESPSEQPTLSVTAVSDAEGSTELGALRRLHFSEFTNQHVTMCEKSASNLRWLRANVPGVGRMREGAGGPAEEEARTAHSSPTKGLRCLAALQNQLGPLRPLALELLVYPPATTNISHDITFCFGAEACFQQILIHLALQIKLHSTDMRKKMVLWAAKEKKHIMF